LGCGKRIGTAYIPAISVVVAIFALVISNFVQLRSAISQNEVRRYEASLGSKLEAYSIFVDALHDVLNSASHRDRALLNDKQRALEKSFFKIEPFLGDDHRRVAWDDIQEFEQFSNTLYDEPDSSRRNDKAAVTFTTWRTQFRDTFYNDLFKSP
jgi:hypothetical protein